MCPHTCSVCHEKTFMVNYFVPGYTLSLASQIAMRNCQIPVGVLEINKQDYTLM